MCEGKQDFFQYFLSSHQADYTLLILTPTWLKPRTSFPSQWEDGYIIIFLAKLHDMSVLPQA